MIRGAVLVLLAGLLLAAPAVDAMPRQTKKQCLKAAKHHRSKAKRRKARKRCLRAHRKVVRPAPIAPPAPSTPTAPGIPSPPSVPDDPGGPTLPGDPADNPRAVQVTSGEYFLRLSKHEVLAGDVRVEFNNTLAEDPHDLKLSHGSDLYGFDELPAGEVEAQKFHLTPGTWQLFCALPEHATRGMTATLTVKG